MSNLVLKRILNVTPFWERIPDFFLCPLKGWGIIILALLSAITSYFSSTIVHILVSLAATRYAMEILRLASDGKLSPPVLSYKILNKGYELVIKQFLLVFLPFFLVSLTSETLNTLVVILMFAFYILALPASIMILAKWEYFVDAVNPARIVELMRSIGWPYLILYFFLILLSGASSTVAYYAWEYLPATVLSFSLPFFNIYFIFVMYAMMGYVMYQYHNEIGYMVSGELRPRHEEEEISLAACEELIGKEDYMGAKKLLKRLIKEDTDNLELRRRFHQVVKILGKSEHRQLTYHGTGMIRRLLDENMYEEAADVYLDCISVDKDFKPESPEHYPNLAKTLRRRNKAREAIVLIDQFVDLYPNHDAVPELYELAANILSDDMGQKAEAENILLFLKQNYP